MTTPKETPPTRGGVRANAGRKIGAGGPKKNRAVTLDDETIDILKEYGGDNLSEGIRRAAVLVNIHMLVG